MSVHTSSDTHISQTTQDYIIFSSEENDLPFDSQTHSIGCNREKDDNDVRKPLGETDSRLFKSEMNLCREVEIIQGMEKKLIRLQQIQNKTDKLSKLTGRRKSLEKISPFLISESVEEAKSNAILLFKSDHLKHRTGERPQAFELQKKQSPDGIVTTKSSINTNIRMNKMTKYFGRRGSLEIISDLLDPVDSDEAIENSIKLRKMEKLRRMGGV
ncbi:Uncharacterized protein QTN25_008810 [Entamoeba marina]